MKLKNFEELLARGHLFEQWCIVELESNGFHCIGTSDTAVPDLNFKEGFFVEAKCKEDMLYYPKYSGFDLKHLPTYLSRNTFLMFMQPSEGVPFGQWLEPLYTAGKYKIIDTSEGPIIVFHRDTMRYDYIRAIRERLGDWE